MHATPRLQLAIVKRLHTQADAIESGGNPGLRLRGSDGFRVCFKGDLRRIGRAHFAGGLTIPRARLSELKIPPQRIQNRSERRRLQQARRATTEVNSIHSCVVQCRKLTARRQFRNFPADRGRIRRIFFARHYTSSGRTAPEYKRPGSFRRRDHVELVRAGLLHGFAVPDGFAMRAHVFHAYILVFQP
jgi:hypothetical protein